MCNHIPSCINVLEDFVWERKCMFGWSRIGLIFGSGWIRWCQIFQVMIWVFSSCWRRVYLSFWFIDRSQSSMGAREKRDWNVETKSTLSPKFSLACILTVVAASLNHLPHANPSHAASVPPRLLPSSPPPLLSPPLPCSEDWKASWFSDSVSRFVLVAVYRRMKLMKRILQYHLRWRCYDGDDCNGRWHRRSWQRGRWVDGGRQWGESSIDGNRIRCEFIGLATVCMLPMQLWLGIERQCLLGTDGLYGDQHGFI